MFCENCGHPVQRPWPVQPLYTLDDVAYLVPSTKQAVTSWASRNKERLDPPSYRWWKRQRRRLYTARDIRTMREALVSNARYPGRAIMRGTRAQVDVAGSRTEAAISVTGR